MRETLIANAQASLARKSFEPVQEYARITELTEAQNFLMLKAQLFAMNQKYEEQNRTIVEMQSRHAEEIRKLREEIARKQNKPERSLKIQSDRSGNQATESTSSQQEVMWESMTQFENTPQLRIGRRAITDYEIYQLIELKNEDIVCTQGSYVAVMDSLTYKRKHLLRPNSGTVVCLLERYDQLLSGTSGKKIFFWSIPNKQAISF